MSLNSVKAKVQKLLAAVKPAIPKRARLVLYTVPDTAAEKRWPVGKSSTRIMGGRGPVIFLCLEVGSP
jgi:hypothetical protein